MENNIFSTRKNYRFIPFDRFDFSLQMSYEEVLEKLLEGVETNPLLSQKKWLTGKFESEKLFEGTIYGSRLEMVRMSGTRNSFVPIIKAEIIQIHPHKTVIRGIQKLHPIVLIFSLVCFTGSLFSLIMVLLFSIKNSSSLISIPVPLLIVVFIYGLVMGSFSIGKKYTREFFTKLFPEIKGEI